jgi:seryl-tRNA synthetase
MEPLEQLTRNVQLAAKEIVSLKNERAQLMSELEIHRQNTLLLNELKREKEAQEKDRARLKAKLEKLNKKIETLLAVEPSPSLVQDNIPKQPEVVSPLGELFS